MFRRLSFDSQLPAGKLHASQPIMRSKGDLGDIFEVVRIYSSLRLIWRRIKIYALIFGIIMLAHAVSPSEGYQTVNLEDWAFFFGYSAAIQVGSAVIEALFFSAISALDYFLVGKFWAPLFYADCFDGPAGGVLWVSVSYLFLKQLIVAEEVWNAHWDNLHISGIVIFVSFGVLNVLQRKSYGSLLLKKYTEKILELDQSKRILTSIINGTLRRNGSAHLESTHASGGIDIIKGLPWPTAKSPEEEDKDKNDDKKKVKEIEMTTKDVAAEDKPDDNEEDEDDDDDKMHEQRLFWRKLRRYSSGIVKLSTIRGSMFLSSTAQAKKIGKRLHKELTKIEKKRDPRLALKKMESTNTDSTDDDDPLIKHDHDTNRVSFIEPHFSTFWDDFIHSIHRDATEVEGSPHKDVSTSTIRSLILEWNGYYDEESDGESSLPLPSPVMSRGDVDDLVNQALLILDPTTSTKVSRSGLQNMFVKIYHEIKFFAGSIQEFSSLHSSLESITNGVFWFIMAIVFLVIMGVDVFELFIPIGTVLIAISFAVGEAIKNSIISVFYVLFILPYDIGDRIILDGDHRSRSAMYVRNISIMKTTFCNTSNETVIYPNHILFSLPLTNHKLSPSAVLEICLQLSIKSSSALIKEFMDRLQLYAIERPHIWAVIDVYIYSIDVQQGVVMTGIWATHRLPWQEYGKILSNKNELMLFLKSWLDMKGVHFEIPMQRIGLSVNEDPVRGILPSHSFSQLNTAHVKSALGTLKEGGVA